MTSRSRPSSLPRCAARLILLATLVHTAASAAPLHCVIEPERTADVGSPVIGILEAVLVQRGDTVRRGQVVARLTSSVERRSVELANARLKALDDVGNAEVSSQYAQRKLDRTMSLVQQGFISAQASDQAGTEADLARKKLVQTRDQRQVYEGERQLATAQYEQRLIRSPIDGVVVDTFLSPGERVEEKAVVRVSTLNPLRVESVLPSHHYGRVAVGMRGTVTADLPNAKARPALVTLVDPVIDASSNTFRIRLKLDNDIDPLPAGLRCDLAIDGVELLPKTTRTASAATRPAPPPAAALSLSAR